MSNLIKKIKIKKQDGTFTDYISIGAEAQNISTNDGDSVQLKLNKKPYYYNNVADMKADTKLKNGDMAITLGYYEANDGGKGEYRIVNGNYIDNGGSYHKLNNNLFAELIITDNKVNVKNFGAKGNNSFDDTEAFSNLINYCNTHLYNLYIPVGKYIISQTLPSIHCGVCIIGELGNKAAAGTQNRPLIRDLRTSGTTEYLITYNSTGSSLLGTSIYNIAFSTTSDRNLKCINFTSSGNYESIIENCSFVYFLQALYLYAASDTTISHCTFNDCGGKADNSNTYGVEIVRTIVVRVVDCLFEHSRWMLATTNGTGCLVIRGNHFELASHQMQWKGSPCINTGNAMITENTFCTRGIFALATALDVGIEDVYYFLSVTGRSTISNNFFTRGGNQLGETDTTKRQCKFLIINTDEEGGRTIITNNRFSDVAFEVPGISIRYVPGVIFSNNIVSVYIQEEPQQEDAFKNYYAIDNTLDNLHGADNAYEIKTNVSQNYHFKFFPRLACSNGITYSMHCLRCTNFSTQTFASGGYSYANDSVVNFGDGSTPTLIVQGDRGTFELEIYDKASWRGTLCYKGLFSFDVRDEHSSIVEEATYIKKMNNGVINFIKQENGRIIIQFIRSSIQSDFIFKINNASRTIWAFTDRHYNQIESDIIYTIQ